MVVKIGWGTLGASGGLEFHAAAGVLLLENPEISHDFPSDCGAVGSMLASSAKTARKLVVAGAITRGTSASPLHIRPSELCSCDLMV